jgi:peptidoglycan/xylan/chitin deacetylase (PgdA/CDA1 family)
MSIDKRALRRPRREARCAWTFAFSIAAAFLGMTGSPCGHTSEARAADSAVILMYQRFDEPKQAGSISTGAFEAHLKELADPRYHVMPLGDVIAAFKSGTELPDRTIAITIDDAYRSAYEKAAPLLKAHGFPFTVFVTSDSVDEGGADYMTWDQIRELAVSGATIGNHGARPFHMVEMGEAANRENITRGAARIAKEIGKSPTIFAYPYGEFGNAERKLVASLGYDGAVDQASGVADADQTVYALPRFSFTEAFGGIDRFRMIANALPLPVADLLPANPKLTANPPSLGFTLTENIPGIEALTCVPSFGGEAADVEHLGNRVEVRFGKAFPVGTGRVTCTAPTSDNRWRWLGVPVYVPKK